MEIQVSEKVRVIFFPKKNSNETEGTKLKNNEFHYCIHTKILSLILAVF